VQLSRLKFEKAGSQPSLAKRKRSIRKRVGIFLWAFIISVICGAIEFGEPLEDVIKGTRDLVRQHDSTGKTVVVGVDERTGAELNGFGYSRKYDAAVLDELFRLGAKSVSFDKTYTHPTTEQDDNAFAAVLRRYHGRVFLGAASPVDPETRQPVPFLPLQSFAQVSRVASLNGKQTPFALSAKLTTGDAIKGITMPSLSYAIAGRPYTGSRYYRPDWSIRYSTIPTVSFLDVVKKQVRPSDIKDKDVVVGPTAATLGDIRYLVFRGFMPGVYLHAIGAETLRAGTPVNLGWLPAYCVALLLSLATLFCSRRRLNYAIVGIAFLAFAIAPIFLDAWLITVDIVPAVLLWGVVVSRLSVSNRIRESATTDFTSGRPNLARLHEGMTHSKQTVVALRLRNAAEIKASFDENVEAVLISELCRRIELSENIGTIHHSGDILVWLTPQPMGHELVNHIEGLHRLSMESIRVGDREVDLSLSFGIDTNHDRLLASRISSAVQCAEEAGRQNDIWKFYDPDRLFEASWILSLMSRLDHAIDSGEIFVEFQPKANLKTGKIVGAEALVRWKHPERGIIGPDQFIPAAEENKRIEKLTRLVLERAIALAAEANDYGCEISVAVNMSTALLTSQSLPIFVGELLEKYHLPGPQLTLEVTETGQIDKVHDTASIMKAFQKMGIRTSVDDFGAGHATYERLKSLRCDEIKIDRQFITNIDTLTENQIIVQGTVAIAQNMKMLVVAEGIETVEELDTCRKLGCDIAQGYLISRPLSAAAFRQLLGRQRNTRAA